jgi:hypothetical protein
MPTTSPATGTSSPRRACWSDGRRPTAAPTTAATRSPVTGAGQRGVHDRAFASKASGKPRGTPPRLIRIHAGQRGQLHLAARDAYEALPGNATRARKDAAVLAVCAWGHPNRDGTFAASHEQIERLRVGGTETSPIERAVREHRFEQRPQQKIAARPDGDGRQNPRFRPRTPRRLPFGLVRLNGALPSNDERKPPDE